MLLDKLVQRLPIKSKLARTIIGGILAALIVCIAVIVVSNLLGFPAPPGVAGVLGAVCGCSYVATHK